MTRTAELVEDEGAETFDGLQRPLSTVHVLASEHRLSCSTIPARKGGTADAD